MSTMPGLASKGEKGKSRFQSLDINSLYKCTLGESLEKQQQKSTLSLKHGMQSLGKVPVARRPPANLPSLKAEHSGTDTAVSLVPSNGSGWGKQETTSSTATVTSTTTISPSGNATATTGAQLTAHQAAIALPVTTTIPPPNTTPQQQITKPPPPQQPLQPSSIAIPAATINDNSNNKSWSAVMTGNDLSSHHPPPYQSPQFQHEFPSLSASGNDTGGGGNVSGAQGAQARSGGNTLVTDIQYGPGPSLRPQTEGSWMQGGSRAAGENQAAVAGAVGGTRNNSAQHVAQPQHTAQAGQQQQPLPPQCRGFVPPFMCRGNTNYASNGHGNPMITQPTLSANNTGMRHRSEHHNHPHHHQQQGRQRSADFEDLTPRPIIKEEELSVMDSLTSDMGWAINDDIDYNQKLAFSDDESSVKQADKVFTKKVMIKKDVEKTDTHATAASAAMQEKAAGGGATTGAVRGRHDDDDLLARRKHEQEVQSAVVRAKQRKEEEEKKYLESKIAANKKYQELVERSNKKIRDKENDDTNTGTINPATVPPQAIAPVPILLPEWERSKTATTYEPEEKTKPITQQLQLQRGDSNDFRSLTQIESRGSFTATRKDARVSTGPGNSGDKESTPQTYNFSKTFQNDLPPRFRLQQQQQLSSNTQSSNSFNYENRWSQGGGSRSSPNIRKQTSQRDNDDKEEDRYNNRRYNMQEENYRSNRQFSSDAIRKTSPDIHRYDDYRHDFDYNKKEMKMDEEKRMIIRGGERNNERHEKSDSFDSLSISRQSSEGEWHSEKRIVDRYDRPQRPDSRDSRTSRESRHSGDSSSHPHHHQQQRHSEPRDYITSWSESHYEDQSTYHHHHHPHEEKKREHHPHHHHRMQVPGPITKEKIEADDLKNERRNLTQLKRGAIHDHKKVDKEKDTDDAWTINKRLKDDTTITGSKIWDEASTKLDNEDEKKEKSLNDDEKKEKLVDKEDKKSVTGTRGRSDSQGSRNSNWTNASNNSSSYRNSYVKKGTSSSSNRSISRVQRHGAESDGSMDESHDASKHKKYDKEERNKELRNDKVYDKKTDKFIPRGEPSRHGRGGGGNNQGFRGGRGGCKRIDGYGPPPVKSPFSNADERKDDFLQYDDDKMKSYNHNKMDEKAKLKKYDTRRNYKKADGDVSDNSDDQTKDKYRNNKNIKLRQTSASSTSTIRRNVPIAPRLAANDKRPFGGPSSSPTSTTSSLPNRQNSSTTSASLRSSTTTSLRSTTSASSSASQTKEKELPSDVIVEALEKETIDAIKVTQDMDGFQEVKAKKTIKVERPKPDDNKLITNNKTLPNNKLEKDMKMEANNATLTTPLQTTTTLAAIRKPKPQLSQQQIANIPSLMATPINPPAGMQQPPSNKIQYERQRAKLPPRFAKQRENNRKTQLQQHHHQQQQGGNICDDISKVSTNVYMKEMVTNTLIGNGGSNVGGNAWEKPLSTQLRNASLDADTILAGNLDSCTKTMEQQQQVQQPHLQNAASNDDKIDGTKPLNTIIFENTNFKTAPGARNQSNNKTRTTPTNKLDDAIDNGVFNKPIADLLTKDKSDIPISQLGFNNKEDAVDMKLDFFENEISHLTEDKSTKNLVLPRTMHTAITSNNTTISPSTADTLNFKIQSVKKVWDATVIDHHHNMTDDGSATTVSAAAVVAATFGSTFGPDPNALVDPTAAFSKTASDVVNDDSGHHHPHHHHHHHHHHHEVYSQSNQNASNSSTTNVCKVKPTQQVAGAVGGGQTILSSGGTHQAHSTMVGPLVGHPLSPPPMQPLLGAGVGLGQPPQQYTTNQHLNYQASLGGNTQYGMPAIPSPPTVLYNSTQQLQAQTAAGLYGTAFQIDQSQVMNNQGRSQYSQYSYGLGQTASSPYSQSMFLQTAQPHAPPTAQAPPDLYPSMNNYRLPATAPFGQNQQLNNPTTVLISSTSNSLMSASVKPSNQQISAIGTKAGGVGQAYQQQSQQQQQLFMAYDPSIPANYLQNTGVMQRGPAGPVQNNVVPGLQPSALQPSSSYYSGSTGGQTGYFQQPTNSSLQSAQMSQHQAGYGLQGSVFGTHNQSHTSGAMQNYASPFLSGPILAAAMSAQQYRSAANLSNSAAAAAYMKGMGSQQMTDQSGRQQLKSPSSQQEALSSVFNSGTQITSPKSRQSCKQPPPQPSPTAQHKYLYQNQPTQVRYPAPIQRPVNFSGGGGGGGGGGIGSIQNNSNNNQKHRTNQSNNRSTNRSYYGGQGANINTQSEKIDDTKLAENVVTNNPSSTSSTSNINASSTTITKAVTTNNSTIQQQQTIDKNDSTTNNTNTVVIGKEDNCAISKD